MNGCTSTFKLSEHANHEANCPYRPVVCYNDGCIEKVKSKDLEAHMELCRHRVAQCMDCKETLLFSDEEQHSQKCPEKEIGCTFNCIQKVRRKEKDTHLSVCTNIEAPCIHVQYGCSYRGLRANHEEHIATCIYKGLSVVLAGMTQQIAQLSLTNQNQAHTVAQLQQEVRGLQALVREQAAEIRSLSEASSRHFRDHFE